jgi:dolichyl-phosphate beta-glucosyltransferase
MIMTDLSIIIPAYNEETLIANTLEGLRVYLSARPEQYQILVVDDGSQDDTVPFVQAWHKEHSEVVLRLLVNERNMGKGYSIRRGVMESTGRFVIFIDADLPYELYVIDDFLKVLRQGHDLAIGSRVLPGSQVKGVPALRYMAGQIFSWMVQGVLSTGIPDTQCGFKSFTSVAAKEIFRRLTIGGFGFDVEMLFIARKLGLHMIEHRHRSRVRLFVDSIRMFSNLFTVRLNDWQGKYR